MQLEIRKYLHDICRACETLLDFVRDISDIISEQVIRLALDHANWVGFGSGILVTLLLGLVVDCLCRRLDTYRPKDVFGDKPKQVELEKFWISGKIKNVPGYLGCLERILFFVAFWLKAYLLVPGWLAFKVASKWETWKNITQVCGHLDGIDDFEYMCVRNRMGTYILQKWLIGTLANVLAGAAGMAAGIAVGKIFFGV